MKTKLIIGFLSFIITFSNISAQNADTIFVASWNVENLFDTVDDPNKRDEEFTPDSDKNWTEARLNDKVENLARVISELNCSKGPDIIGFIEVEHKSLLEMLFSKIVKGERFEISYAETQDFRGIDNGLAFDKNKFELIRSDTLVVKLEPNRTTRFIFYNQLKAKNGELLNIFVNHWPSRGGGEEKSDWKRISAANTLKAYLITNQIENDVILFGDFNDEPDNSSIKCVLSAKAENLENYKKYDLINLSLKKDELGEGTYNYRGNWNMIDQMIVSQDIISETKFDYVKDSFGIYKKDYLLQQDGKYKGSPNRTYGGKKYLGGYSDHLAIYAKFILK